MRVSRSAVSLRADNFWVRVIGHVDDGQSVAPGVVYNKRKHATVVVKSMGDGGSVLYEMVIVKPNMLSQPNMISRPRNSSSGFCFWRARRPE